MSAQNRIAPVDGLRTVAALGVLWAHVWVFMGNPTLSVGTIGGVALDLNRAASIVGTGVDLFFVISGFCMYLMYARSQERFSWPAFASFVRRRWMRIAPAFYAAALAAAVGYAVAGHGFPWLDFASHLAFANILVPGMGALAAPFWSLATEWHFYLVLPAFIWAAGRFGFWRTVAACAACTLAFRVWVFPVPPSYVVDWHAQLPARLIEFIWGTCVARLYLNDTPLPRVLSGWTGFIVAVAIAYLGRVLAMTAVVKFGGVAAPYLKVFSEPVLTLGYALMLWNVVSSESVFRRWLSHSIPQAVGRWSYSLYLWHWWPAVWICGWVRGEFGATAVGQYLAFATALAVLIPIAWLSYRLLEAPYFAKRGTDNRDGAIIRAAAQ